jgi:hypothetical protein
MRHPTVGTGLNVAKTVAVVSLCSDGQRAEVTVTTEPSGEAPVTSTPGLNLQTKCSGVCQVATYIGLSGGVGPKLLRVVSRYVGLPDHAVGCVTDNCMDLACCGPGFDFLSKESRLNRDVKITGNKFSEFFL